MLSRMSLRKIERIYGIRKLGTVNRGVMIKIYQTIRKHISNIPGNTRSSVAASHFRPNKRNAGMT